MTKRVVVTGLGIISPVGIGKDSFWKSLLEGKNGIGKITLFDAAEYSAQIAGEVTDFEPTDYLDRKDARHMDRYAQFAVVAAQLAIKDAGLDLAISSVPILVRVSAASTRCTCRMISFSKRGLPVSRRSSFR